MIINCEYKLSKSQVNHICVELDISVMLTPRFGDIDPPLQ
jgi:hypothetical protein